MHQHLILPYHLPATSPKLTSNSSTDNSFSIPPMLLFHAKMQSFFFPQKVLWNLCVGGGKKSAQHGILSWQIRIVNSNCLWQICIMIRHKKRRSQPLVRVHFLCRPILCILPFLLSFLSPSFWLLFSILPGCRFSILLIAWLHLPWLPLLYPFWLLFSSLPDCLFPSCWLPFFIFPGCLSLSYWRPLPYPTSFPFFILLDDLISRQVRFPSPFCFFRLYETGQPLKLQNRRLHICLSL